MHVCIVHMGDYMDLEMSDTEQYWYLLEVFTSVKTGNGDTIDRHRQKGKAQQLIACATHFQSELDAANISN